ncbi:MAG: hypothetical protein CMC15_04235 [Flavobacteriaceae bacterium]|jgi:hypothetical protein|nr:hypothetical protein [Flavobacteriaceae bacterium]MAM29247.1 hypothetical protein [Flavobacteriaceae bacterium]MAY53404.1 hypothetical protein [Flavobacteriaceae bacterium]|tara:strand:+ start:894 stop:1613 length:720 start_codon:yes stop_codon:yes gene_type:complete
MPLFTKSLKLSAFNNKRIGRYLLYALGEIVLVVVGILLALNINNANEDRKNEKEFRLILKTVAADLANDTLAVNQVVANYKFRQELLKPIINGEATEEELRNCTYCGSAISSYAPVFINDKGYLQLKNFFENTGDLDSLSTEIVQFYNYYTPTLQELGDEVKRATIENVKDWRDNYPWFANIINNKPDPRYLEYLASDKYRNRASYFNIVACLNYKTYLEEYKLDATEILESIAALEED